VVVVAAAEAAAEVEEVAFRASRPGE
jgi:hypothetical protein